MAYLEWSVRTAICGVSVRVFTTAPAAPASTHFFSLSRLFVGSMDDTTIGFLNFIPQNSTLRSAISHLMELPERLCPAMQETPSELHLLCSNALQPGQRIPRHQRRQ